MSSDLRQRSFETRRGFSLVEMILAVGIASLVMLSIAVSTNILADFRKLEDKIDLNDYRMSVEVALKDRCAWGNTFYSTASTAQSGEVSNDGTFQCYRGPGPAFQQKPGCGPSDPGAGNDLIELRDRADAILLSKGRESGITYKGTPCSGFSSIEGAGNDACPIKPKLKWRSLCPSGQCWDPMMEFSLSFAHNPATPTQVSLDHFEFSFIRPGMRIARSCRDHIEAGASGNDLYMIDPDGAGGECPFQVWCDLTGWALIINSPSGEAVQARGTVTPYFAGRLSDGQILAILDYSARKAPLTGNNVKVQVQSDLGYEFGMKLPAAAATMGYYRVPQPTPAICRSFQQPGVLATVLPQGQGVSGWGFFATQQGGAEALGFISEGGQSHFVCRTAGSPGPCSLAAGGACSGAGQSRLIGAVWVLAEKI